MAVARQENADFFIFYLTNIYITRYFPVFGQKRVIVLCNRNRKTDKGSQAGLL
jgi:hypothetical protein